MSTECSKTCRLYAAHKIICIAKASKRFSQRRRAVVPGGMRDDALLPRGGVEAQHRVERAAELERARRLRSDSGREPSGPVTGRDAVRPGPPGRDAVRPGPPDETPSGRPARSAVSPFCRRRDPFRRAARRLEVLALEVDLRGRDSKRRSPSSIIFSGTLVS